MANFDSVQHSQLVAQVGGRANVSVAWGVYEIAVIQSAGDTMTMFTLPAGTTVIDGWLKADDIDVGIETLEFDVGDADDTTRFLNSGVLTGDANGEFKPEAGISIPLFGTLKDGPYTYTSDTDILVESQAAAATTGLGTVYLYMLVTYDDARVSPPDKPL